MQKLCTILISNDKLFCSIHKNNDGKPQTFEQKCNAMKHLITYNLSLLGVSCINTVAISGLQTYGPCLNPNTKHKKCQWIYTIGIVKPVFHEGNWKYQCQYISDGEQDPCGAILKDQRSVMKHLKNIHNLNAKQSVITKKTNEWKLSRIANYETHSQKVISESRISYLLNLTASHKLKSSLESTPILGQALRYNYTNDYTNGSIDYVTTIHDYQEKHNIAIDDNNHKNATNIDSNANTEGHKHNQSIPEKRSILSDVSSNNDFNGISGILNGVHANKIELNISIRQVRFFFFVIWYSFANFKFKTIEIFVLLFVQFFLLLNTGYITHYFLDCAQCLRIVARCY